MEELSPTREVKQGRRAGNVLQAGPQATLNESTDTLSAPTVTTSAANSLSPRPTRREGGWADESKDKRKGKAMKEKDDDERLKVDATVLLDNDIDDIPVIPDLDDFQEDDLQQQIAAPPSVQVTRVATYKELDHDFEKHTGILTLDGDIDLKLLGSVLSSESEVMEEDKVWDWDRVFTEVASDLRTEWENAKTLEN